MDEAKVSKLGRFGCLAVMAIGIFAVLLSTRSQEPSHSESYWAGYNFGLFTGKEHVRYERPKLSPAAIRDAAKRLLIKPPDDVRSRADYEEGWCDGYASGYDFEYTVKHGPPP